MTEALRQAAPAGTAAAEQEAAATETVGRDASRLAGLIGSVVAPAALVSGIAYYFGWRREQAFAGYFGIDTSLLDFSSRDYVIRSVDALFVPLLALLLVALGALSLHVLLARRGVLASAAPSIAAAGVGALVVGALLAWGHGVSDRYVYLQALGPAVGALLLAYALSHLRAGAGSLSALRVVTGAVALVSLFWATSEYADGRGRELAGKLAADLRLNPSVTILSKERLSQGAVDFDPAGSDGACTLVTVTRSAKSAYHFKYVGFTFLLRNGGRYFVTATPLKPDEAWDPTEPVVVVPEDAGIRVLLTRGGSYDLSPAERTAAGRLAFTC